MPVLLRLIPGGLLAFLALVVFIVGSAYVDARFLGFFELSWLPWFLMASSLALAASSYLYAQCLSRGWGLWVHRLLPLGVMFVLLLAWWTPAQALPLFGVCVLLQSAVFLQAVMVWNILGGLFQARESRRCFPLLTAASSLGAMCGGLLLTPLIGHLGLNALALCLLLPSCVLGLDILFLERLQTAAHEGVVQVPSQDVSPLFGRSLVLVWFLSACAMTAVDYHFKLQLKVNYGGEEIGMFLGRFYVVSDGLALLLQLGLVTLILSRFGLLPVLLLLPAALLSGASGLILTQSFWAVVALKLLDNVMRFTFYRSGEEVILNALADEARQRLKPVLMGVVTPVGVCFMSLTLIVLPALGQNPFYLGGLVLILALCWCWAILRSHPHYLEALRAAVSQGRNWMNASAERVLDAEGRALIAQRLRETDSKLKQVQLLELLARSGQAEDGDILFELLGQLETSVQPFILRNLSRFDIPHLEDRLVACLRPEDDDDVLCAVLELLLQRPRPLNLEPLRQVLAQADAVQLRAQAAACLVRSGASELAAPFLFAMAESDRVQERAAAQRVLPALESERAAMLMMTGLRDSELEVRRACLQGLAQMPRPELVNDAFRNLEIPALHTELAALGQAYGGQLLPKIDAYLRHHPLQPVILHMVGAMSIYGARSWLLERALQSELPPRERLLAIRQALRVQESLDASPLPPEWEPGLRLLLRHYRAYAHYAEHYAQTEQTLLQRVCSERQRLSAQSLFHWLAFQFPRAEMRELELSWLSGQAQQQSNALELLDSLMAGQRMRPELLMSLEKPAAQLELSPEALAESDPWLKICLEGSQIMPSELEKVLLLQAVPLFQGLDTDILFALSQQLELQQVEAGQAIFAHGDPGDALYVLVSGQIEICRKGVVIRVLEHEECFGELALLDGQSRSADAVVGSAPAELLRLPRARFQDLLDTRPELMRGILNQVVRYNRENLEQMDRAGQ